jgi:hypothetical protein
MARKGVSPVLASLLLVVIAAAAAIATYLWVSSYLGSAGRGVEAPQFRELLKVEGVREEGGSLVVTVRNIGSAKATLRAAYVMKEGVAVASETLNVELEPGQAADVRVSAQVPPGSYTVKIVMATGVEAIAPLPLSGARAARSIQLVKNGDFSEGSAYWTLEDPWRVDPQQYARAYVETNSDFEASIYQDVEIPAGTTSLTLSFSYYLDADPPGQVEKGGLTLKAYLLSGGNVVWESNLIQWNRSKKTEWKQFTQTFTVNVTGKVTLKITLTADVKKEVTIDAGLDNVSLLASAPP